MFNMVFYQSVFSGERLLPAMVFTKLLILMGLEMYPEYPGEVAFS